jgi:hypothetical protein
MTAASRVARDGSGSTCCRDGEPVREIARSYNVSHSTHFAARSLEARQSERPAKFPPKA